MALVSSSLKLPEHLLQAMKTRSTVLGYPSFNAYLMGLARYDLICQGEHTITGAIARAKGHVRDKLDSWLLRLTERGVGKRGVLLNHIIDRMQRRNQTEIAAMVDLADEDEADWSSYCI